MRNNIGNLDIERNEIYWEDKAKNMATLRQWRNKLVKGIQTKLQELNGFEVIVFDPDSVPDVLKLTKMDKGKGVWIAGEYKTISAELKDLNDSSVNVYVKGHRRVKGSRSSDRNFFREEVILHPDELTEERLEKFGYEIKDGRTNG